jgi:hypothetical protein
MEPYCPKHFQLFYLVTIVGTVHFVDHITVLNVIITNSFIVYEGSSIFGSFIFGFLYSSNLEI